LLFFRFVSEKPSAQSHLKPPALLAILPAIASITAICIGTLVLIGWSFDLERLKRVLPGFVAMNPMTATLFIFAGTALAMSILQELSGVRRTLTKILSVIVVVAALTKLLDVGITSLPNVDELLFASKLSEVRNQLPNRMAPNTALNFILVGLSLLTLPLPAKRFSPSQAFAILAGFGALLPVTGYAYGVRSFQGMSSFIPMALHTAVTFLILAAGLFFARPETGFAQVFAKNDPRGVMARRLFPLAVLLILFLGWLRLWGERQGFYESKFGTALFAITLSILFVILVRWTVWTVSKLEDERAIANARLHDLNRRKDEMIAVVSHDLCSPLTGFRMVIDLLREKPEQPSNDLLDLMDHSARRMVSMVRGLLDVAKLQSDEVELEYEEMLVSDAIRQSMEPLAINANAKQITLKLDIAPGEPIVRVDHLRVSQIFNNLLSNAVKFTAPGGRVSVSVDSADEGVRVAIADTGLGIPKNDLPHVFDKYYQASTKATGGEKGTGLGLAIVRELVLLHGGKIDVSSELNRGTTFTVYLPQKPSAGCKTAGVTKKVDSSRLPNNLVYDEAGG
jgi:signal transduction histidine kinase